MTLFKITCDTCRTSLNVRQKSAIGQILACPKCGSMVQVKPPEGWDVEPPEDRTKSTKPFVKPTPDPNLPETVSTVSGSVAEGLPKQTGSSTKTEQRWQGENGDGESPTDMAENSPPPPVKQPDLPGNQWDSSRAKQRKKLLMAFSTATAVLIFGIAAIIFATMQFAKGNGDESSNDDGNSQLAQKEKDAAQKPDDSGGKTKPKSDTSSDKKKKDQPAADEKKSKQSDPGKATGENLPPRKPEKSTDDVESDKTKKPKSDSPPDFAAGSDDVDDSALSGFFRELDDLAVVFEQDEPLLKLRKAFSEKDLPGTYGLSRYFVSKSLKRKPNADQALQVPLAGVSFKQTTLLEFLHFHYQLSGVPVSVDVTPILLAGIQLDQKFDFSVSGKTTYQTLSELADQLGLDLIKGNHSLVLTIKDRNRLIEASYDVKDIAPTNEDREQLVKQIGTYVNRHSWSQSGGDGIVTANDEKQSIVVKHFGWAQVRVQELLRHMRLRKGLSPLLDNPNFPEGKHRLKFAESSANRKITLLYADPVTLSELFAALARNSNLHIFVNWEATGDNLLPSGNLPLAVEDMEFGTFISEFTDGVKLQLVWHGPNTVELTTQAGASSNLTFESYDITRAISKTFTAEKLLAALRNLLVSNGLADFQRAELGVESKNQNSIFAVLPQSAHLNVLKILQTAETVGESE